MRQLEKIGRNFEKKKGITILLTALLVVSGIGVIAQRSPYLPFMKNEHLRDEGVRTLLS